MRIAYYYIMGKIFPERNINNSKTYFWSRGSRTAYNNINGDWYCVFLHLDAYRSNGLVDVFNQMRFFVRQVMPIHK